MSFTLIPGALKLSPLAQGLLQGGGRASAASAVVAEAVSGPTSAPDPLPVDQRPVARRSKLWELGDKHHCPVIGTCLTVEELTRLARRFKFQAAPHVAFALHVEAVSCCHQRNPVAEWVQRHLDEKYRATLSRWSTLTTAEAVLQQWRQERDQGAVAAALWTAYTHKHSNSEIRQALYADIHMLSHQVGAGLAADVRRLNALEAENQDLKQRLAESREQWQAESRCDAARVLALEHALTSAQQRTAAALADLPRLQQRLQAFETGQVAVDLGQRLLTLEVANERLRDSEIRLATQLQAQQAVMQTTLRAQAALVRERDAALDEARLLSALLNPATSTTETRGMDERALACSGTTDPGGPDCAGCPSALTPRCVLYVGGRTAMVQQYRQLASRLGVELLHHDGGLEEALSRLPELIHGADAVVCPTDQVSHSAYYQVKTHCKRSGKPCLFYKGGGVSSFAVAMGRLARGQYSLTGERGESVAAG